MLDSEREKYISGGIFKGLSVYFMAVWTVPGILDGALD